MYKLKSKKFVGTWSTNIDITDLIATKDEYPDFDDKLELKLIFTFNSDGSYSMSCDSEEAKKHFNYVLIPL